MSAENSSQLDINRISFQQLREKGHKVQVCPWLLVYWDNNHCGRTKILWSLSKKVGNAVVRNRLKRLCREFIRIQLIDIQSQYGLDLNLVFRPVHKNFYKDLQRADIIHELGRVEKRIRARIRKNP